MSCLVPLQPCHLFLPWLCRAVLQLAQGMRCTGPQGVPTTCGDMAHTRCWVGHHSAHLRAKKTGALLTSPVPCTTLGVHAGKAAAMARNCNREQGHPNLPSP